MFLAPLRTGHSWHRSAGDGKLNGREAATSDVRYGGKPRNGGTPIAGWFICVYFMEFPIQMDDLGLPPL